MSARKRDRPLSARLAELTEAIVKGSRQAREAEIAHRRVEGEIARLRDAAAEAYSVGDEPRAQKASRERAELEGSGLREAEERLDGARRAVQRADVERSTFAMENLEALIAERHADATAAAAAVEDAAGRGACGVGSVHNEIAALHRLAGSDTRGMPRFLGSSSSWCVTRAARTVCRCRRRFRAVPLPCRRRSRAGQGIV